jgi:hypothetical protein
MKDYSIHHVPGRHLTFADRQILARDWNRLLDGARKPSMSRFAAGHGLAKATWCREYWRGAKGFAVRDERDRRRRSLSNRKDTEE